LSSPDRPRSPTLWQRWWQLKWHLRAKSHIAAGYLVVFLMRVMRWGNRKRTANTLAALMRTVGPWLREHRIARDNLVAAFPEKSAQEIDAILSGSWDSLGRVAAEFLHLDRITILDRENPADVDVIYDAEAVERLRIIQAPGPRLIFGNHLGNWELPARFARYYDVDCTSLFRAPNIRPIANAIVDLRAGCMGTLVQSGFDAPIRLARALERGGKAAMLVDQYDSRGIDITFFGRVCKASPLLAQLARHLDCPIHGVRMVRLADRNKFWVEVTDPIEPVRDAEGKIDIAGTTQAIANVSEAWVREHPDQWLWQHRRWR
jgi:KDO2-lipid IV(A) lauroyltransferase